MRETALFPRIPMRTLQSLCFVLILTLGAAAPPTQAQQIVVTQSAGDIQLPGMPGARQFKTGTGRIRGRVVSADSGAPIRRAQVRISGPDIGSKAALTDAEGRYEFRDLPAGRFSLNASKAGYVNVQYGQTRPFEQGRQIELADKQLLDKADIIMPRGSVISGRIVDEFGEPVADAMVTAMRQTWMGGRRRLVPAGRFSQTNDLGQYRMYGLPPGDYYVSATLRNSEAMMFDVMGTTGGPTGSNPGSGYAPTYYPGTPSASEAQKVVVALGQEAQQTDFALLPVRLARVSGMVVGSDGKPLETAMVNLLPASRSGDMGMMMMGTSARTSKDGQFTLNSVAPGDYTLNVRSMRIQTSDAGGNMTFMATVGGPDGQDGEFASIPLTVAGEDIGNVAVVTTKGSSVAGRLVFEGGSKPANTQSIRISATPDISDGPMMVGASGGTAKADGTFELKGLSGHRMIRVSNPPQGWALKAVRLSGTDITDSGLDLKTGEHLSNLEIVLTSKTTEVNGSVTTASGQSTKDYTVVVFSEDPDQWAIPMSRWVAGARSDQDGRFKISNMPPGSYYVVALDYIESGAWGDPELLDRLKTRATRFTLGEGQTQTLDLKLTEAS
jgi:protocatechuate 3,4-dioxygenase beta subunit